jgi:hypothetical protein
MEINVDTANLEKLRFRLSLIAGSMEKVIGRATKRTAAKGQTNMIRQITDQSWIKPKIAKEKARNDRWGKTGAVIELRKTGRLGTRHFKGTQDPLGMYWQVGRSDKWRFMPRGFSGPTRKLFQVFEKSGKGKKATFTRLSKPKAHYLTTQSSKWKGNSFVRAGTKRLPIVKILGVSPWGFFKKNNLEGPTVEELTAHLKDRILHEARYLLNDL